MRSNVLTKPKNVPSGERFELHRSDERSVPSVNKNTTFTMLGLAALAGAVWATLYYGPDFIRYLKIKRM